MRREDRPKAVREASAPAIGAGLYRRALERPESVVGRNREEKRNFAALPSSAVSTDGHVRFRMAAAATTAAMPRSARFAAARDAIDHGNRVFDGIRQFLPFQQSVSRAVRRAPIRRQGCFRGRQPVTNDVPPDRWRGIGARRLRMTDARN